MSSSLTKSSSASAERACFLSASSEAVPLYLVTPAGLSALMDRLGAAQATWVRASGFAPRPGEVLLLPAQDASLAGVLVGVDPAQPLWQLSQLARTLPVGVYALDEPVAPAEEALLLLGWALGASPGAWDEQLPVKPGAQLVASQAAQDAVWPLARAIGQVRRLINTPANHLGPTQLAGEVRQLAERHGAVYREWVGDALPAAGFPLVHAVGRAAADAPRVAELTWGDAAAPRVVLVGKGVCFDTGGLDLKPAAGMRWMKKDMGGAAHAMALAELVMQARLPVRLTLVIPAVENAVGAGALRPGDVVTAGDGTTVEIENTDAEGRLVLADALHHALKDAGSGPAALAIDLATLTGAARVALGPDLPALFSNSDAWAQALLEQGERHADPMWRMPLWRPYRRLLTSGFSDTLNAASAPLAGAITAALFLERFVPADTPWLHVDLFAWNQDERPGRPKGGEAQGLRALFALLRDRFAPA